MNYLEYYSNYCALIIIITSSFYIENKDENIQTFFLILIVYFNITFLIKWSFGMLKILMAKYEYYFSKFCPKIYSFLFSCISYLENILPQQFHKKMKFLDFFKFTGKDFHKFKKNSSFKRIKKSIYFESLIQDFQFGLEKNDSAK